MYRIDGWLDWFSGVVRTKTRDRPQPRSVVPANVVFLGLTSLFTDISSEMVISVLPMYLIGFLRMSPAQFGLIDGVYQGAAGVVQLVSAVVTDRLKRYKEVAAVGYAASLLSRVGLLVTTGTAGITALLTLDRLGKGVRTAPRDALISLSVSRPYLGTAFGIHRAMDALGAMLGPVVAFAILAAIVDGYDVVFVFSLCSAVIGIAILGSLVENKQPATQSANPRVMPVSATLDLLRAPAFRHLALSALLLGSMTISDGFVYLTLQNRTDLSARTFPLLYVLTSAGYLLFAIPVGKLADKLGRFPVFLAGHALLIGLYATLLAVSSGRTLIAFALILLGLYYAATEGVLMALGSALVPEELRASGLALLTTSLAVARFMGSVVFGLCWTRFGLEAAVVTFLLGLGAAIGVVAATRPRIMAS